MNDDEMSQKEELFMIRLHTSVGWLGGNPDQWNVLLYLNFIVVEESRNESRVLLTISTGAFLQSMLTPQFNWNKVKSFLL